jgi:hypothetical protein
MKKIVFTLTAIIGSFILPSALYAVDNELPAEMIIYSSLGLTLKQIMTIPEHEEVTTETQVVLKPDDPTAAIYSATGGENRSVQASVTTPSIELACQTSATCGDAKITVNNFTFGGDLQADGTGTFTEQGKIDNMRVGGTATLNADDKSGRYFGVGTFRLVYA